MKVVLDLKVVMDTNVFVSGVFFSGPPYRILNAWQSGEFELVISREILDEYRRVGEILASGSRVIISGDKHLLKVSGYEGIDVLKPREFVDRFLS